MNGYFKESDERTEELAGHTIPSIWWSRVYEYPWALEYATGVVADMGAGWMDRPFKDMLSTKAEKVFAFDIDQRLLELRVADNVSLIAKDFTRKMDVYHGRFDRIFCISVLEDIPDMQGTLQEFERCLKPGGLVVLTMDVKHDPVKPLGKYPGVNLGELIYAMNKAGLQFVDDTDFDKEGAVHNDEFNLCCFHCVLERANE